MKVKTLTTAEKDKINARVPSSEASNASSVEQNSLVEESSSSLEHRIGTSSADEDISPAVGGGSRTTSKQEFLSNLNSHFTDIVVGGMEASMRKIVSSSIEEKRPLKGKANQAVINSINHHILEYIGRNQRPDKGLCRLLSIF